MGQARTGRGMLHTSSSLRRCWCSLHLRHDRLGVGTTECPLPSTSTGDDSMGQDLCGLQRMDFPYTLCDISVISIAYFALRFVLVGEEGEING